MKSSFWLKMALFNFLLIALIGVLMRYKILYSFPFLDQKNLQQAHSHFAFYGFITHTVYVLMVKYLQKINPSVPMKKYDWLINANLFSSFAMLALFVYGGYFWGSIVASAVALLISFVYAFYFYKDSKVLEDLSLKWFRAGLFFAIISSLGVFTLSYMKSGGSVSRNLFLAAEYFYLHFQYNGFFSFSCIGLLLYAIREAEGFVSTKTNNLLFWLMFAGCLVGFGLSVLWLEVPIYIYSIIVISALAQTFGAVLLFNTVKKNWISLVLKWSPMQRFVLLFVGLAFGVKILLQLGSTVPALSQFAFGFRTVVIAYLHLVLLMGIATFLLNQILATNQFLITKNTLLGLKFYLAGTFLTEVVLGVMGILSIKYISLPYANEMLLLFSALVFVGLLFIQLNLKKRQHPISGTNI